MENKTFHKKTRAFYKAHVWEIIGVCLSQVLLIFIGVLPCFFYFPFFLFTLPLLICPGFLGIHIIVDYMERKQKAPTSLVLCGFPPYYGMKMRGTYRVAVGLLKGLGVFFASVMVVSFIYVPIASSVDQTFTSTINQIADYTYNGDVETVNVLMQTPCIQAYVAVVFSIAALGFCLMFTKHLSRHAANVPFRGHYMTGAPGANRLFLSYFSLKKDELKSSTSGISWMAFSLFLLGYVFGFAISALSFFVIDLRSCVFGVAGGFSFLAFYWPYVARYSNLASYYYSLSFREFVLAEGRREFLLFQEMHPENKEDLKDLNQSFETARAELDRVKETFNGHDYPGDQ